MVLQSVAGYLQSDAVLYMFNDLIARATDSPLVSLLFTQGRYRNASLILLLQNMFPKGKLAIENKSVSLQNECLTKIARDSCQLIFKKRKGRLVISSLTTAQTHQVISKYWVTFSALVFDIRQLTSIVLVWRHYCNGKSKWIYLHKDDPSIRSYLEKNQTNAR